MDYNRVMQDAEKEIASLLANRQRIDARIALLKAMVQNCRNLLGMPTVPVRSVGATIGANGPGHVRDALEAINAVHPDKGITEVIREALENAPFPLSASEVRFSIEELGFDLSEYANAGAVIHNTLTRLGNQGEVVRLRDEGNQTVTYALATGEESDGSNTPGAQGPQGAEGGSRSAAPSTNRGYSRIG